ncbi:TonB-dependent receptor [Aquipseudomonas campi]|uniref:TonB-dependent receptor n=1 Tax=Aquipseudomonas campi TaxID=2731681 RepID=A0A6M8FMH1_9GAMM|nr:TonB-dependent receptor [Pseudomonas campi]QKE61908.1 TonB-dependent receptor [Pseudomonas campi]
MAISIRHPAVLLCALTLSPIANAQSTDAVELSPLNVTGQYVPGEQTNAELEAEQALTPGGVTLVDSEDLKGRNISNLADMLRYVPGVFAASGSTGDSTFLSSRGSNLDSVGYDGNGIKLMQDGLPVTAADGNNHNRAVDPLSARHAIVARGANALTYGASTLGGAIDFITPTARDVAPFELALDGGSDDQAQGRITAGTVAGDFDALVTAEARHWDGYRDQQHEQNREGVYANAGWQFSEDLRTRLYLTSISNDQQLPGALTESELRDDPGQVESQNVSGNFQYNVDTWRVANKTTWDIDANSSFSVGFSYEEQDLYHPIVDKVMVDFDGPGPMPPTEVFSLLIDTEQRNAGTALRYNLRLGDHDLLAGLNYGQTHVDGGNYRNDGGHRNGLTTHVDNQADNLELFLMDRWQFVPDWTLVYGAQAVDGSREVRNTDAETGEVRNPEGDYDSINPRVGLIHQLTPDVELFANLSRLYEAPTTYELDDDIRGNEETLDAMHGTVFEVGTRGTHALGTASHWHWDLALYYAKLRDEILSMDDPAAPGTSLSTNVDNTIHAGIETLVGASFAIDAANQHRLEPLVNLTINRFSFDNDATYGDNDLPAAPDYFIKGEVLYRNANGFFAGPTFDVVGERYADFSNTYKIDSYALMGLRAGLAREDWEVYGEVRNLTDKTYVAFNSVVDEAAPDAAILNPGEPRSVFAGVRLNW